MAVFRLHAIAYISGLTFGTLFSSYYFGLILVALILAVLNYKERYNYLTISLILFTGWGWSYIYSNYYHTSEHILINQTSFIVGHGEIEKIKKSPTTQKSSIYFTNLFFKDPSLHNLKRIKLSYNRTNQFTKGDILLFYGFLFPPSNALFPNGPSIYTSALASNISAYGYIVGKPELIDNNHHTTYIDYFDKKAELFKAYVTQKITPYVPSNIAAILLAISIGEYTFLPKKEITLLRDTGLAHFISISGYHISLLSLIAFLIIRYTIVIIPSLPLYVDSKRLAAFLSIIVISSYMIVVKDHTPALRAAIMVIAFLSAIIFQVKSISINNLLLAGIIILSINPRLLTSTSFLLSFFATLAVIRFWENSLIQEIYKKSKKNLLLSILFFIVLSIGMTSIIQLTIAPIMAFSFGKIPIIGILANVVVTPIFTFLFIPSLIMSIVLPEVLAKYTIYISSKLLQLIIYIAEIMIKYLNFSVVYTPFFNKYFLMIFLIIIFALYTIQHRFKWILLPILLMVTGYYIKQDSPDILVTYDTTLVAFKEGNHSYDYSFNTEKASFFKNYIFKNPKTNFNKTLDISTSFDCKNDMCITERNQVKLGIIKDTSQYKQLCNEVDLIIITSKKPWECNKSLVIDKEYLDKKGSVSIFLKKGRIKVVHDK